MLLQWRSKLPFQQHLHFSNHNHHSSLTGVVQRDEGYLNNFERFMPTLYNADFLDEMRDAVEDAQSIASDEFYVKKQATK